MRTVMIALFFFCVCAFSGPIEDLAVHAWYEVPNSHLYDVRPSGWTANVIGPWSSGAFDTKRDRLIVWGGGHGDYAGNEVYVFDLNTLAWERLNDPSDPPAKDVAYASDGGPCSRHTYEYIDYVPNIDRFCSFGGAGFWQSGQTGTSHCDCFNFDDLTWEQKADVPSCGGFIGANSAWDALTGNEWVHGSGTYSWPVHWNPSANAWTAHGRTWVMEELSYYVTSEIDPKKRKMVACGGGAFHVWDISKDTGTVLYTDPGSSGSGVNGAASPGLAYDPVTERIIGWSSGQTVYSLNLDNNSWTSQSASGANPGSPCNTGTFGRFRYSPNKNVFVLVNNNNTNVFIYRHTAASSAPQWYLDLIEPPSTAIATPAPARDGELRLTATPNPFNSRTRINYELQIMNYESNDINLAIYDINGKRIADFTERIHNSSFIICNSFEWNASKHPAGVYLARAEIGGKILQKKLFLVK